MAHARNLSTGEAKAAESQVQGQPGLFSKCEASLGYVGPCLTTTKVHQGERHEGKGSGRRQTISP